MNQQEETRQYQPMYEQEQGYDEPPMDDQPSGDVDYIDYSREDFGVEAEEEDVEEEVDDKHRFHVAMNVFDTISVLAGLAVVLVLAALLISMLTWLQTDVTHSFTLLTSQLQ